MTEAATGIAPGSPLRHWLQQLWGAEGLLLSVALVQSVVVARLLGVADFGVAALVLAVPMMVFVFLDPQSEETVIRFMTDARSRGKTAVAWSVVRLAYRVDVVLAVAGMAVVAVIAVVGVAAVGVPDEHRLLLLISGIGAAVQAPTSTARAALTSVERFNVIARATSVGAVVQAACSISGAMVGELAGFIAGSSLGAVIGAGIFLLSAVIVRQELGIDGPSGSLQLDGQTRQIIRFMMLTEMTTLSSSLVKHVDVLILGGVAGPQSAGIYRLARSVSTPVGAVLRPLQLVAYPQLEKLAARRDAVGIRREIRRYLVTLSIPLSVVGGAAVAVVPVVLPMLAGDEYADAVEPAVVLAAGSLVTVAAFWMRPAALALRREAAMLAIALSMTVITVVGYFMVASQFGAVGVAVVRATVAALLGNMIAGLVVLRALRRLQSHDHVEHLASEG